jgi:hypothetical protein
VEKVKITAAQITGGDQLWKRRFHISWLGVVMVYECRCPEPAQ